MKNSSSTPSDSVTKATNKKYITETLKVLKWIHYKKRQQECLNVSLMALFKQLLFKVLTGNKRVTT